jgi:hypothetical protein
MVRIGLQLTIAVFFETDLGLGFVSLTQPCLLHQKCMYRHSLAKQDQALGLVCKLLFLCLTIFFHILAHVKLKFMKKQSCIHKTEDAGTDKATRKCLCT